MPGFDGLQERERRSGDSVDEDVIATGGAAPGVTSEEADRMRRSMASAHAASPAPAVASAQRLAISSSTWDLGEQIVDGDRVFEQASPFNTGTVRGSMRVRVVGGGNAFSVKGYASTLFPSGSMRSSDLSYHLANPLQVGFNPQRSGDFTGMLVLEASFDDGKRETHSIQLKASARTLEQAPRDVLGDDETPATTTPDERRAHRAAEQERYAEDQKITESYPQNAENEFNDTAERAASEAQTLADKQELGVHVVEQEAQAYQRKPPQSERSIWWDLAEIALSMGTAGLAGMVATRLGPRITAYLKRVPVDSDAVKDSLLAKGVTDAVKDGLKGSAKKGLEWVKGQVGGGAGKPELKGAGDGHSSNQRINFFADQRDALQQAASGNRSLIIERSKYLRPLLRSSPELAVGTMNALRTTFVEAQTQAERVQKDASSTQWLTLVARANLGTDSTTRAGSGESVETTDLDGTRKRGGGIPAARDGLLDIVLQNEYPPAKVVSARVHGVAQEVADRVQGISLHDVPMPVRLVLGSNLDRPTIVTRDEGGRIRIDGDYAAVARHAISLGNRTGRQGAASEEEAHQGAEVLVEAVLGKSLAEHGVPAIGTDDTTGRGG